jgi:hypothetical protein
VKSATVGFRVHSGWSAVVAVCLEKREPEVLLRRRVHLVEAFTYDLRQPYHTAEKLGLPEGSEFISKVQQKARDLAYRAIRELQAELQEAGCRLNRGALLLASARPLPELEKILASHALIHTADGELFRECLLHASERCGLTVMRIKDRELLQQASKSLGVSPANLLKRATKLGRPLGAPWSQDEKFATIAAWLASLHSNKTNPKALSGKRA